MGYRPKWSDLEAQRAYKSVKVQLWSLYKVGRVEAGIEAEPARDQAIALVYLRDFQLRKLNFSTPDAPPLPLCIESVL
ncbi:hypothetical protein PSPO01_12492 [Paraphaeosphaeria sporulosa]